MNEWHAKPQEPAHNKQCHNVYFFAGIKRKKQSRIQHHARGFLVFFLPKGESWVTKWAYLKRNTTTLLRSLKMLS